MMVTSRTNSRFRASKLVFLSFLFSFGSVFSTEKIDDLLGDKSFVSLPPQIKDGPIEVDVGLNLVSVDEINEELGVYSLDFFLWFEWQDDRLKYEDGKFEGNKANFLIDEVWEQDRCWDPVIEFLNLFDLNIIEQSYRVLSNGRVRYIQRNKSKFKAMNGGFDYHRFPFDRQTLSITIESLKWDNENIVFKWAKEMKDPTFEARYSNYELPDWDLYSFETKISDIDYPEDPNPFSRATCEIVMERKAGFYLWKICLPLFLLVFLSWSVFFLSPEDIEAQLTLSVTTVLAIVTFSILINQDLPKISYLSILDLWLVISFVFCVISALESVVSRIYFIKGRKALGYKIDYYSRIVVPISYVSIMISLYFFYS